MREIDLNRYPKIPQTDQRRGCIPVNIENALKYYGEYRYDESSLLNFYDEFIGDLGFKRAVPYLKELLPEFEIKFKGRIDFNSSLNNVIEYIKSNINEKIPVLVSFKVWEHKLLWSSERGPFFKRTYKKDLRVLETLPLTMVFNTVLILFYLVFIFSD